MGITHTKVSAIADGADATKIQPSDWNDTHTIDAATITKAMLAADAHPDTNNLNGYNARTVRLRNHWSVGSSMYFALSGSQPAVFGDWSTDWTNNARIIPLTGTGRIGVVELQNGEVGPDARCRVRTAAQGAFDSTKFSRIAARTVLAMKNISTNVEEYYVEAGLVGNKWAATDDALGQVRGFGHFFRYNRTQAGVKWIAVNRNLDIESVLVLDGSTQGGIPTVDAGNITDFSLPASGFFCLDVLAYANSSGVGSYCEYWVNGVLCGTMNTNMVTHSLAHSVENRKTAGNTSRSVALDYTELAYTMRTGQDFGPLGGSF